MICSESFPQDNRFNEAAALLPRKVTLYSTTRPSSSRFNEAAALLPRKVSLSWNRV